MYQHLDKTGVPPQKQRNLLKAGLLAVSMGTLLPTTALAASALHGIVFNDTNGNSLKDASESVRPNETIFIRDNTHGGFFTTTTDAKGEYSSAGHGAGSFTVWTRIPPGWTQTAPKPGKAIVFYTFDLGANETKKIDFGLTQPPPNKAPTAHVGDAKLTVDVGETVNFTAIINDPDGDKMPTFGWRFGDGSKADNTLNADHVYTTPGTYTAVFSVNDEHGAKATANVIVTVENVAPIVSIKIDPATVKVGKPVTFTGEVTDPGENTHTYAWYFGDKKSAKQLKTVHTYTAGGKYVARLIVKDNHGGSTSATTTIVINNATPIVDAGADVTITAGETVNFNGKYNDPDKADTHTFMWSFGDKKTARTQNASHTYTVAGTYVVTLTVTDSQKGVGKDTLIVTVNGAVPVVKASASATVVNVGEKVTFNGALTDADGGSHNSLWVFGDGNAAAAKVTNANAVNATHIFTQPGDFTAVLQITDSDGNKGRHEVAMHVRGIDDNPCDPAIATIQSVEPWNVWENDDQNFPTWKPNQVPTDNDWVLIKAGHTVVLPSKEINVKGLCIEKGAVLQSAFNTYANPPSWVNITAATVHNKGTIKGEVAASTGGDCTLDNKCDIANNWLDYKHAEGGSNVKIFAYKVVNDGTIQAGTGGTDSPWKRMNDPWSRGERNFPITGGKGGFVEIQAAIITNNNLIQSGNGGDGDSYKGWLGRRAYIHGPTYGGKGGNITTFATLLEQSTNAGTLKAGCGGIADIPRSHAKGNIAWITNDKPSSPGKGGDVYANVGKISGRVIGCTGGIVNWDPPTLKATSTTRIEGFDKATIFGGENWTMDLRELSEGAISAGSIKIAVGKGGKVDLRGLDNQAFKAETKLEILADEILLDEGVAPADLVDAPSVVADVSKILYHVGISNEDYIVEEPSVTLPIKFTLLNGGPLEDTYSISVTDSAGWQLGDLPATVTVNSMRRSELVLNVTLSAVRGEEDIITITATSKGDPNVQAVKEIRVGVKAEEVVIPRGDVKADMVFVIDETRVMRGEHVLVSKMLEPFIEEVNNETFPEDDLINTPPETGEEPIEEEGPIYELKTFKDEVTSHIVTRSVADVVSNIRSLQPVEDRACSSATIAALESALENISANGQIVLVTASSPTQETETVIAKAQELGIKLHVLLTGSCGDEEADKAIYQDIVNQTGGDFNQIRRGQTPAVEIEQVISTVVEKSITEVVEIVKERDKNNPGDDDDTEVKVTPASCMVYGVQDKGKNDSIFFSIDFETGEVKQIGPVYEGYDIEAMTVSRDDNILIVASGNDTDDPLPKGHVYYLDASTGELVALGSSGFEEIGGLTFAGDGTLWAWAKGDGLVQLNPVTGQGTLELPTPALLEDLTASRDGTVLYGPLEDQLWSYDPTTGTLTLECDNLERETEAVEFLLDGILLLGRNGEKSLMLHAFDIATCSMIANRNIKVPFNDVEGLAVPHAACLR